MRAKILPISTSKSPFIPEHLQRQRGKGFAFAGTLGVEEHLRIPTSPVNHSVVYADGNRVRNIAGFACDTSVAMKAMDDKITVSTLGALGGPMTKGFDPNGVFLTNQLGKHRIDTAGCYPIEGEETTVTLVLSSPDSTYSVHVPGACAQMAPDNFKYRDVPEASIVVAGHMNFLRRLTEDTSGAAEFLEQIRGHQRLVGVAFAAPYEDGFQAIFEQSALHADFLIISERSLAQGTEKCVRKTVGDKELLPEQLLDCAGQVIQKASSLQWIAIHMPEGALYYSKDHEALFYPSYQLNPESIISPVGAGNNWLVGFLAAGYFGCGPLASLAFANAAAGLSMIHRDLSRGPGSLEEIISFTREMDTQSIPPGFNPFVHPGKLGENVFPNKNPGIRAV